MRARLLTRYVLGEMIPTFFLGVIVFVFILLMFQALRLTEFVLVHGVKLSTIAQMMGYLSTSFLPILFPMSLLFTVILTYGRMSADSEVVAMKATGLSMWSISTPALILSTLVCILSLQTSFYVAPWGNRQFEQLVAKLGSMKPGVTIKEGTFSEGFFDLVVYANQVDNKAGRLIDVFIYDERNAQAPITVIAREGELVQDPERPGHSASLRLINGSIHRGSEGRHTKIDFSTYDLQLFDPIAEQNHFSSPTSMGMEELSARIEKSINAEGLPMKPQQRIEFLTEFHRRIAIGLACLLFGVLGVALGTSTNRRGARSGGTVVSIGVIVIYWALAVSAESLARQGQLPPGIAMWLANFIFMIAAVFLAKKTWA
jgi:LPS export ABC transporter permease LptF